MSKNDERTTIAKGFIVKLNPDTLETEVIPFKESIKYTRTNERAAAYVAEKIGIDANAMIKVTELVQTEYERRAYSPAEVYATAAYRGRVYEMDEAGTDDADPMDVLDCKRIVTDVYNYSIVCMVQTKDGSYRALKIRAYDITECRSGLSQFQAYAEDVLQGKRSGLVTLYNGDGTTSDVETGDIDFYRVAAWDVESRCRRSFRVACYLTEDELSRIPYTVYKRGEDGNGDDNADK